MTASKEIAAFIQWKEGRKLKAYLDTAGVWTIGTGATYYADNSKVKEGDVITEEQADTLFNLHLKHAVEWVKILIKKPLNQNQFDAVTSFMFNFGPDKFKNYPIRRLINADPNNFDLIGKSWVLYVNSGGKPTKGLKIRRKEEFDIYRYGTYPKK